MSQFVISTREALDNYKLKDRFEENQTVYISEEDKYYIFHDGEWMQLNTNSPQGEFSITAYELNKMLVSQLDIMPEDELEYKIQELNNFEFHQKAKYHMLLCRDINYYTIFAHDPDVEDVLQSFGRTIVECVHDVGEIVSIERMPEDTYEFWVKTNTNETYCMYLFNADGFVVPYRG